MTLELSLMEVNALLDAYQETVSTSNYRQDDPHPDAQAAFSLLDKLEAAQSELMSLRDDELTEFTAEFAKLLAEEVE